MINSAVFKFLDSYTKEDQKVFFGRESETEEIYQRCTFSKTLVVYGRSGTGKTSIIRCGLGNAFNDQDWLPLLIRRNSDINHDLLKVIRETASKSTETEKSLHTEVRNLYLDYFKPVYLIFDQFEELFIFGDTDEIATFFANVKSLISSEENVHLIFVIREEYLANLTEAEEVIPDFLENRIRIEHLSTKKLREVVEKMCEAAGIALENGFSEELTARMTSGKAPLELSYLQVYLDAIQKKYPKVQEFTKSMIDSLGTFGDVLRNFLQRQLEKQKDPAQGEIILKAFVSVQGTKRLIDLQELKMLTAEFGVLAEINELKNYVSRFVDDRILRQLGEDGKYELRHDTLAKVIYDRITLAEKELMEAKQFVHNAYNRFHRNGTLLRDEDLDYLSPYSKRLYLKGEQKKFLNDAYARKERRQKRKSRSTQIGVAVLLSLLVGAGALLYENYKEKQIQGKIDESHRLADLSKSDDIGDPMLAFLLAEKAHEIYAGPHTHNALMEAYDKGPGMIENYPFQFINISQTDSIITFYSDEIDLEQLSLSDAHVTKKTSNINNLDHLDWLNYIFFKWGYLRQDGEQGLIISQNYFGDTIDAVRASGKLLKVPDYGGGKSLIVIQGADAFFVLNSKGQFSKDIKKPSFYYPQQDEFVRNDTLFILGSKRIFYNVLGSKSNTFEEISLAIPDGQIVFQNDIRVLQVISQGVLMLIDPYSFDLLVTADLNEMMEEVFDTFGEKRKKDEVSVSYFDNEQMIIRIGSDYLNPISETTIYSIILNINELETDILGLVRGEILGICGANCYLTYSRNSASISMEYCNGKFSHISRYLVDEPAAFENVNLLSRNQDRFLVQRKEVKQSILGGTLSKSYFETISLDGELLWSLEWKNSGNTVPTAEAAVLDNKNNALILIRANKTLFLLKIDPSGTVVFKKQLPLPRNFESLKRKPNILPTTSGNYIVALDDRLLTLMNPENTQASPSIGFKEYKDYHGGVIITENDSFLRAEYIKNQGKEKKIVELLKKDTLKIEQVRYLSGGNILQVKYKTPKEEVKGGIRVSKSTARNDFYLIDEAAPKSALFSYLEEKKSIRVYPLNHSAYNLITIQEDENNLYKELIFCKESGNNDTLNLILETGAFRQFGESIYACGNDTIVTIGLEDLRVSYIKKKGANRFSKVYALNNSNPFIIYAEEELYTRGTNADMKGVKGWMEFENADGVVDTLHGTYTEVKIDSSLSIYFLTKLNWIAHSDDERESYVFPSQSEKILGDLFYLDNHGRLVDKQKIPDENSIGQILMTTADHETIFVSDSESEIQKLVNSKFENYFSFPLGSNILRKGFIHDKYIFTSHRLLNQYELFPINGDVIIEMVRQQGKLGKIREFTDEEKDKYLLNQRETYP